MRARRRDSAFYGLGLAFQLALFSTTALAGTLDNSLVPASAGGTAPSYGERTQSAHRPASVFDVNWYLASNPDVWVTGVDPLQHYRVYGWREGRMPNRVFDPAYYLASNPDVRAAGIDPLAHFLTFGWREGRNPSADFRVGDYLRLNPDVAAAGLNPMLHYLEDGQRERRRFAASPEVFRTPEYNANYGLNQIRAADAYARGVTGAGVTVGILDTGIDLIHPDLTGQIAPGAFDIYNNRPLTGDSGQHGTWVAGVIAAKRNGTGTQGVAYNARVLPVAIFGPGDTSATSEGFARAFRYAAFQGARVINASYTNVTRIITPAAAVEFDAIQDLARAGVVMVFAAGNEGAAHPALPAMVPYVRPSNHGVGQTTGIYNFAGIIPMNDWSQAEKTVLAVVAVDRNGQIAPFSNRCGAAARWCLAAPGVEIRTTSPGGGYQTLSGTSFAAPHVSGAVALLMEMWPHLSGEQVVTLLLNSATPLGTIPGNDPVYGRGLLNLERATQPQGVAMVPLGSTVQGALVPLATSTLQLSPAFGDALASSRVSLAFLDSFGRDYVTSMASFVLPSTRASTLGSMLSFGQPHPGVVFQSKTLRFAMTAAPPPRPTGMAETGRHEPGFRIGSFALTHMDGAGHALHLAYGDDPRAALGLRGGEGLRPQDLPLGAGVGIPYLAMAQRDALSVGYEVPFGDRVSVRTGAFFGRPEAADQLSRDDRSRMSGETMGALTELRYSANGLTLGAHVGMMSERGGLLGLRSQGAFSFGTSTPTYFTGVSGQVDLTDTVSLFGSYHVGLSVPRVGEASLFSELSGVRSSSFSLGVSARDVLREKDRVGVVFSQPLRVDSARASFNMPLARDVNGNVLRYTARENLAPKGRELNLQMFYHTELSPETTASIGLFTRFQPDNRKDAKTDSGLVVRVRHTF